MYRFINNRARYINNPYVEFLQKRIDVRVVQKLQHPTRYIYIPQFQVWSVLIKTYHNWLGVKL